VISSTGKLAGFARALEANARLLGLERTVTKFAKKTA
jgi:O6-methylguanine-DNA--protein-cysteine methyltransferase